MVKANSKIGEDIVVLIPAAGIIKSACNYNLASDDPGFLNIGTSLAIEEIRKKTDIKILLAVEKKDKDYFKLKPYLNIEIIEVSETKNITETIQKSLAYVEANMVLINPVTSIPTDNIFDDFFIEFGSLMLPKENWSSITLDNNGLPIFHSKFDKDSIGLESYPFTGRILANKNDLITAIKDLNNLEKEDLIFLARELFLIKNLKIKFASWLDIGHVATYPITKVSTITSRFFNFFNYDTINNVLIKKSENIKKIEQEIEFYRTMPNEIKRYFPTLLNVKKEDNLISYEIKRR